MAEFDEDDMRAIDQASDMVKDEEETSRPENDTPKQEKELVEPAPESLDNLKTLDETLKMLESKMKATRSKAEVAKRVVEIGDQQAKKDLNNLVEKLTILQRSTGKHDRSKSRGSAEAIISEKLKNTIKMEPPAHSKKFQSVFKELNSKAAKTEAAEVASQGKDAEMFSDIKDLLSDSKDSNHQPDSGAKTKFGLLTGPDLKNKKYFTGLLQNQAFSALNSKPTNTVPKDITRYFEEEKKKIIRRVRLEVGKADNNHSGMLRRQTCQTHQPIGKEKDDKFEAFKKKYFDNDMNLRCEKIKLLNMEQASHADFKGDRGIFRTEFSREEPKELTRLVRKLEMMNKGSFTKPKQTSIGASSSMIRLHSPLGTLAARRAKAYGNQTRLLIGKSPNRF